MTEKCKVIRKTGKIAYVQLKRNENCSGCNACLFGKSDEVIVPAVCDINCMPGDNVIVQMPEKSIKSAPAYLYAIPLLFMLIGVLTGGLISQVVQIIFAFVFLLAACVGVGILDKFYFRRKIKYNHVVMCIDSSCD